MVATTTAATALSASKRGDGFAGTEIFLQNAAMGKGMRGDVSQKGLFYIHAWV
jgi:hypothetical protein